MSSSEALSVSELIGRKIKPTNERFGLWLLLENLDNLITDVGNINYTEKEQLMEKAAENSLIQITEPFCDNIMIVKICSNDDCNDPNSKSPIVKKELCGDFNSHLREMFKGMVSARHGVKAQLPFLLHNENCKRAKGLIEVIGENMVEIDRKYGIPIGVPYKIELADIKLEDLLKSLPNILTELKNEDYYFLDLDITQDFAGIFNKEEMLSYLKDKLDFQEPEKEDQYALNELIDNDNTVGIDCLTWSTSNARIKIYNKFICQITSPGVDKSIGNHIVDFISCPDKRLKNTFESPLSQKHGITRLEITIYNYSIADNKKGQFTPLEDCCSLLEKSKEYFRNAPFYSVSIAKMWTKLSDSLKNSCCVVFNDVLQYVYWGNSNTRKLTGIQINFPTKKKEEDKENTSINGGVPKKIKEDREDIIKYCLSAFSFNSLPVHYLEVLEDIDNKEKVRIIHKSYLKNGETFFSKSTTAFSTLNQNIDMQKLGIASTKNISPRVLTKRPKNLLPFQIDEIIDPAPKFNCVAAKKRKLELEEAGLKRRKLDYFETAVTVEDEFKRLFEKIAGVKQSFRPYCKWESYQDFKSHAIYNVYALSVENSKFKKGSSVTVLVEPKGIHNVYSFKGHQKKVLEAFSKRIKEKEGGYTIIPHNGLDIICLPTVEPFLTIKTNEVMKNNNAKIEKLDFKNVGNIEKNFSLTQDLNRIYNMSMKKLQLHPFHMIFKNDFKSLETLEQGQELKIIGMKDYKRGHFLLDFQNLDDLYISNYWFEKEMEELGLNREFKIMVKLDMLKSTPKNKKERVVFCMQDFPEIN